MSSHINKKILVGYPPIPTLKRSITNNKAHAHFKINGTSENLFIYTYLSGCVIHQYSIVTYYYNNIFASGNKGFMRGLTKNVFKSFSNA